MSKIFKEVVKKIKNKASLAFNNISGTLEFTSQSILIIFSFFSGKINICEETRQTFYVCLFHSPV
jgi:hypothetical protein